jgi:hypothetical protein
LTKPFGSLSQFAGAVKWYAGLAFTPISVDELLGDDEQLAANAAREIDKSNVIRPLRRAGKTLEVLT